MWRKFSPADMDIKPGRCKKCGREIAKGYYLPATKNGRGIAPEIRYCEFHVPDHVKAELEQRAAVRATQIDFDPSRIANFQKIGENIWTGDLGDGNMIYAEFRFRFLHAGIGRDLTEAQNTLRTVTRTRSSIEGDEVLRVLSDPEVLKDLRLEAFGV